jgi:hypothetical protein
MPWKRVALVLSLPILLLVLLAGCRTKTAAPAAVPVALAPAAQTPAAQTPYAEFTYPQSDDQGHYVGLPQTGEVTLSGIVAAPSPPTGVVVNGVTVQPYLVQDVAPFGAPAGYSIYGFDVPTTITPTTLLTVALQALGVTTPAVTYAPNSAATYARLLALAAAAPQVPQAQYRLANVLLAQRNYNGALAAYRRSLALQPQYVWGYDGLGHTYVLMQRPADAVIQFKKAKKLRPKWAYPYYRLAEVYTSQKRYDAALLEYREGLRFAPGHPGLHRGYAVALYNRGHYREAWNQVHIAKKSGAKLPADFEKRLRGRMPEPSKDETARNHGNKGNNGNKQTGDQKRQDGVRAPGPHAQSQTDKHQKGQDGLRRPGPHASKQPGKNSKGD